MSKKIRKEILIPESAGKKFKKIKNYPLISVEAPLGYGKTELLNKFLAETGTMYIWTTVKADSLEMFWEHFCGALSSIDYDTANKMENSGFPSNDEEMVRRVSDIEKMERESDVVLVIDDYHRIKNRRVDNFMEMLAREGMEWLHIVVSGRKRFNNNREELIVKKLLLVIEDGDLALSENECRSFFLMHGAKLTPRQVYDAYKLSEGWITIIIMILDNYGQSRSVSVPPAAIDMFDNSVYGALSGDEQDFLLRVCLFERFTLEQARFIRRKSDPFDILMNIVSMKGLISYDPGTGYCHLHRAYSVFLRRKLEKRELKYRAEVFRHAADWHYLNGEFGRASYEYYRSGNFEDMLKTFELNGGRTLAPQSYRRLREAFGLCPDVIKDRHPVAMMIYARHMWMMGDTNVYEEYLKRAEGIISGGNYSKREKEELSGELNMLRSFTSLNDISKSAEYQRAAAGSLRRATAVQHRNCLFSYGVPTVLSLYHREPGNADQLREIFSNSRDIYYRLTDNNGRGAEYQLEAELCYHRGDFYRAEILSYKAFNVAKKYSQPDIMICSLYLQMKLCIIRGDSKKTVEFLDRLKTLAKNSGLRVYSRIADLCEAGLYMMYNESESVENWILEGPSGDGAVYRPMRAYLSVIYGRLLIEKGEYTRYLGESDSLREIAAENNMLLPLIYFHIYDMTAFSRTGYDDESYSSASAAFEKAMPDGIIMPFVENGRNILEILNTLPPNDKYNMFTEGIVGFIKKYEKYMRVRLVTDSSSPLSLLTKREQDIVMLVSDGKTNREIAEKLNIAEITVKKCLSNVYARLGVSNRASLIKKLVT